MSCCSSQRVNKAHTPIHTPMSGAPSHRLRESLLILFLGASRRSSQICASTLSVVVQLPVLTTHHSCVVVYDAVAHRDASGAGKYGHVVGILAPSVVRSFSVMMYKCFEREGHICANARLRLNLSHFNCVDSACHFLLFSSTPSYPQRCTGVCASHEPLSASIPQQRCSVL